ncbi:ASC domain containing protein [Asbolus verrucosus]|uniref:ASC domain containing protein n=1 Tax=Asbolus verrucosus TaxID=1661398 RepID=A0A482W4W3_ASBVE|nr:ASC domain containing protein [Asbolus verrucosus]
MEDNYVNTGERSHPESPSKYVLQTPKLPTIKPSEDEVILYIPDNPEFHQAKSNFRKNISDYFTEYSFNTAIHGLKYLGERGRSATEKVWWLLVFFICIYKCVSLILPTIKKWKENPVFVSASQTPLPVWEVPFPAVTFCPENKIKRSKFNIPRYIENIMSGTSKNFTMDESLFYIQYDRQKGAIHEHYTPIGPLELFTRRSCSSQENFKLVSRQWLFQNIDRRMACPGDQTHLILDFTPIKPILNACAVKAKVLKFYCIILLKFQDLQRDTSKHRIDLTLSRSNRKGEFLKKEYSKFNLSKSRNALPPCGCLPACTSVIYNAEIHQSYDTDLEFFTYMRMFFKDTKIIANERNELFGEADFRANCGGLLGFRKNVCNYFTEYTNNTSIHGFKYMGERRRPVVERLWWLTIFCISLYVCIHLIINIWIKWDKFPVLISFAQSPTQIWQVPFPAVTICPENQLRQTKYNFTEYYYRIKTNRSELTSEELRRFYNLSIICDNDIFDEEKKTTDYETIKYLMSLASPLEETVLFCKLSEKNGTCKESFTPIMTNHGLCFTFNMLDKNELFTNVTFIDGDYLVQQPTSEGWTFDGDYFKTTAALDTYPKRALAKGMHSGLMIDLQSIKEDIDYVCNTVIPQGFKILLHHPAEFPLVESVQIRAPFNEEMQIVIKPDMITTSASLEHHHPNIRKCFFSYERPLKFFRIYTEYNCQIECTANYTLAKCGKHLTGVSIYFKHSEFIATERKELFGLTEFWANCGGLLGLFTGFSFMSVMEIIYFLSIRLICNIVFPVAFSKCDCLSSRNSIKYNAETSILNYSAELSEFKLQENHTSGYTLMTMEFTAVQRREIFSSTDFYANCDGLLGLFIGFSWFLMRMKSWIGANGKGYMPHHTYCQQEQISGWDADDGYIETNQSETFPKRVVFASSRNSVEFMVLKYPGEKCNQSREKGIQCNATK